MPSQFEIRVLQEVERRVATARLELAGKVRAWFIGQANDCAKDGDGSLAEFVLQFADVAPSFAKALNQEDQKNLTAKLARQGGETIDVEPVEEAPVAALPAPGEDQACAPPEG